MSSDSSTSSAGTEKAASLADLPPDELLRYGVELGLQIEPGTPSTEIARLIRKRKELLLELDREALLEIVIWARRPVRQDAGKEELAREIARANRTRYKELSHQGLLVLARLREIDADPHDSAEELITRLKRHDGIWKRFSSRRRAWVGALLSRVIEGKGSSSTSEYRFLPEEKESALEKGRPSIKSQVEEHGVVGGIAQRLRGAADDYIRVKLDEIEARIDAKLDEIDKRLGEWRDREVANRLKILRITLVFTVIVAVLSLGYNYMKKQVVPEPPPTEQSTPASRGE